MDNSAMSIDASSPYYVDPVNYQMEDWKSFYNSYTDRAGVRPFDLNPDGMIAQIVDFFDGSRKTALAEYNRQKELKDRAFEEAQLNAARRYQEYLESSKYQRTAGDLKAAGFNPWVALQSSLGQANVSASPSVNKHSSRYLEDYTKSKNSSAFMNLLSTAIRVGALIALAA